MSENYSISKDLKEAEAMSKALLPYVHRNELYGNVGGMFSMSPMPSLTLGALNMRLRRLSVLCDELSDSQQKTLEEAKQNNATVMKDWRVHYEEKLLKEVNSRLDAMNTYFEECNNDNRLCYNAYSPEASRRTIAQEAYLTLQELGVEITDELRAKIAGTDSKLRRYVQPTDFIWSSELEPAYPKSEFWWLYARPPQP